MQFYFWIVKIIIFFSADFIFFGITRSKQVSYSMHAEYILWQSNIEGSVFLHVYSSSFFHIRPWNINLCLFETRAGTGLVLFRKLSCFSILSSLILVLIWIWTVSGLVTVQSSIKVIVLYRWRSLTQNIDVLEGRKGMQKKNKINKFKKGPFLGVKLSPISN